MLEFGTIYADEDKSQTTTPNQWTISSSVTKLPNIYIYIYIYLFFIVHSFLHNLAFNRRKNKEVLHTFNGWLFCFI